MRVLFCWANISGYMSACWQALAARTGWPVHIIAWNSTKQTAFAQQVMRNLSCTVFEKDTLENFSQIKNTVFEFEPDVVFVSGWMSKAYRKLVRDRDLRKTTFIMGMDTPWLGHPRQYFARYALSGYLARMSRVVVTGERSWQYAVRLGVPETKILRGLYGVEFPKLPGTGDNSGDSNRDKWPRQFLFCGRYEQEKGLDILLYAYSAYRNTIQDPWPLVCCGKGPLKERIGHTAGAIDKGFLQPHEIVALRTECGAFILPSRFDPWPLALAEACAAGLPVIASEACGSAVELVRPFYNGFMIPTADPDSLTRAMLWVHEHHGELREMGGKSAQLAAPYSAESWARRWEQWILELLTERSA